MSEKKSDSQEKTSGSGKKEHVNADDFYAYAPENRFIFIPDRSLWPASSVNARIPHIHQLDANGNEFREKATDWLSKHRSVEQMTWIPGYPQLIKDKLISSDGWIDKPGCRTFNQYQPPTIKPGDPEKAGPWIDHIKRIYPYDVEHILNWFASRVQRPSVKINHAIVLGGAQGIGKDTILEPVSRAVGLWNFKDITPSQILGRFNGFIKSVILRVSEARDMGEVDRYGLYEHIKAYTTSPPIILRCDEKYRQEYGVVNVFGVIYTTNHKAGGIYLPADDRRHYVAWSECNKDEFDEAYFQNLWAWYCNKGGFEHVTAYLQQRPIDHFDPKAPPPKTSAFWEIVDARRSPEDAELADVLDKLENPKAVTIALVAEASDDTFKNWLLDQRNRRNIPHRFESAGYMSVRNDAAKDGLWKIGDKRTVIYVKRNLSQRERIQATQDMITNYHFYKK